MRWTAFDAWPKNVAGSSDASARGQLILLAEAPGSDSARAPCRPRPGRTGWTSDTRDRVPRGLLAAVEAGRRQRHVVDLRPQDRVDAGLLRKHLVSAAPDELRPDALGQRLAELEVGRPVGEVGDADGLDRVRQERTPSPRACSRTTDERRAPPGRLRETRTACGSTETSDQLARWQLAAGSGSQVIR